MKKIAILLLVLFSFSFILNAQSLDKVIESYSIGARYYNTIQYDSALYYFEKALVELDEDNNGVLIDGANIRTHIANTYCLLTQYSKAIDYGIDALKIFEQLLGNSSFEYAIGLKNLSWYYESAGEYQEAVVECREAAEIFRSLFGIYDSSYISSMEKLAFLYQKAGDAACSKSCYKKCLDLEEHVRGANSENYALLLNNLGFVYSQEACYDTAAYMYRSSAAIRKELLGEDNDVYKQTMHNLKMVLFKQGESLFEQGEYVGAINAFLLELNVIEESNDTLSFPYCYAGLSDCYWLLGDFSKAFDCGLKRAAWTIYLYGDESVEYANAIIPLLHFSTSLGMLDMANEIAGVIQVILNHHNVNSLLFEIFYSELQIKQNVASIESLLSVLNHYVEEKGKQGNDYYALLNNLSLLYLQNGDYENGIRFGKECVEGRAQLLGELHPDYLISLNILAEICYLSGSYDEALAYYKECYVNEKKRASSFFSEMTSSERTNYWLMVDDTFKKLVSISEQVDYDEELNSMIYDCLLFSKWILLNYDKAVREVVYEQGDEDLLTLYESYNRVRSDFALNHSIQYSEREYYEVFSDCNEMERLMMRKLKVPLMRYVDSISVSHVDVLTSLSGQDVAIEFCRSLTENDYFAIILEKPDDTPQVIKLNNQVPVDSIVSLQYKVYDNTLLYDFIWTPIEPYLNEGCNVYYAADGLLHQINIENLVDSIGKLACEKYNLHRVSSTRQICNKHIMPNYNSVALFGGLNYEMNNTEMIAQNVQYQNRSVLSSRGLDNDSTERAGWKYLPGTKEEVQSIYKICENQQVNTFLFIGNDGTEEAFKSLSGQHISIIHIATHGFFFDDENASDNSFFQAFDWSNKHLSDNSLQRSGLIMSGGQNAWLGGDIPDDVEDGILLSEEIASMDLSGTNLVVLSACETGLGDITSDGVFGLQRAFKMAGVQTLVMSLWKVDDNATSLMMQTFYEHLLSGVSKREAFNLAQAAVRAKYPEPYYWAGFIMLD